MTSGTKALEVLKSLIISYVLTGIALAVLAFAIFKFQVGEAVANIAIIAIYVLATFVGAYITGKKVKEKKFFWGFILGLMYILIIFAVAIIVSENFSLMDVSSVTAIVLCVGGGLLGGMLS